MRVRLANQQKKLSKRVLVIASFMVSVIVSVFSCTDVEPPSTYKLLNKVDVAALECDVTAVLGAHLESPGYPEAYVNGELWVVCASVEATAFSIEWEDFATEYPHDYVAVYNPEGNEIAHLSGEEMPNPIDNLFAESDTPIKIAFWTDGSGTNKGFAFNIVKTVDIDETTCGNSAIEAGEICDGTVIVSTCADEGFASGSLSCLADCSAYDTSGCVATIPDPDCGNDVIEGDEECDNETFASTCADEGFDGGDLACSSQCTLNTSGCTNDPECNNNSLEPGELCDSEQIPSTCTDEGFFSGQLSCSADCESYITTECTLCGNGELDALEECDGDSDAAPTCQSLGYSGGLVVCGDDCLFDSSDCTNVSDH